MVKIITECIDAFYFPFLRFIPLKTFRYAACGGSNLVFAFFNYFVFYNFIFAKQNVDLNVVVLSPHIASLFFVFPITFVSGFLLNKYVTFSYSDLPGQVQFGRYLMVGIGALILSYFVLKFLVEFIGIYPTPAKVLTLIVTVIYSYLLQNHFSFSVSKKT